MDLGGVLSPSLFHSAFPDTSGLILLIVLEKCQELFLAGEGRNDVWAYRILELSANLVTVHFTNEKPRSKRDGMYSEFWLWC